MGPKTIGALIITYTFGGLLIKIIVEYTHQNPILIIKAPILRKHRVCAFLVLRLLIFRQCNNLFVHICHFTALILLHLR